MSQLLFSLTGRLNRKPYWLTVLAIIIITIVLMGLAILVGATLWGDEQLGAAALTFGAIIILLYIPLLWINIALGAKRLHDRNKSAWWLVLFWLVPGILSGLSDQLGTLGIVFPLIGFGISIWGLVEIGFLRGTVGPNQYGPDPLATV